MNKIKKMSDRKLKPMPIEVAGIIVFVLTLVWTIALII